MTVHVQGEKEANERILEELRLEREAAEAEKDRLLQVTLWVSCSHEGCMSPVQLFCLLSAFGPIDTSEA